MGTNIITKTDRRMEDQMLAVSSDPQDGALRPLLAIVLFLVGGRLVL